MFDISCLQHDNCNLRLDHCLIIQHIHPATPQLNPQIFTSHPITQPPPDIFCRSTFFPSDSMPSTQHFIHLLCIINLFTGFMHTSIDFKKINKCWPHSYAPLHQRICYVKEKLFVSDIAPPRHVHLN